MRDIVTIKLTPENKSYLVIICKKQGCSTREFDTCFGEYIEKALQYFLKKHENEIQFISNSNGGILSTLTKGTIVDAFLDEESYDAIIKMATKYFIVNFALNEYFKDHIKITENKTIEFKEDERDESNEKEEIQ